MKAISRKAKITVLIVGEGACEVAFLRHVRDLYISRECGVSVTVRDARGKGPGNVIAKALGEMRNADFSHAGALLDRDVQWTDEVKLKAQRKGVAMLGSEPCLEGLLLLILGRVVPASSAACKDALYKQMSGDPTLAETYAKVFSRELLEQKRATIRTLDQLLKLMSM